MDSEEMGGELLDTIGLSDGEESSIQIREVDSGLEMIDTIERRRYRIQTSGAAVPEPIPTASFKDDVDVAFRITTDRITLPYKEAVYVRDGDGAAVGNSFKSDLTYPSGQYLLDITTSIKLYLQSTGPLRISQGTESTTITFEEPVDVGIGVSTPSRQPIGTITTSTRLDELSSAIAAMSAALGTTTPERSFPLERAHPPRLEVGDGLRIPSYLDPPDTGVTLELRRTVEDLLVGAPLAFYLGADIEWGERRIVTETGFDHSLTSGFEFHTGVERALKQAFLLDCVTRTEGRHPVTLDARERLERRIEPEIDYSGLYSTSLAARVERYLEVPYETVADLVPPWSLTAYVEPHPSSVTVLPSLVDHLAVIRTQDQMPRPEKAVGAQGEQMASGAARSTEAESPADRPTPHFELPTVDAATSLWVGDGVPVGGAKAFSSGFRHGPDANPTADDIRVTVLCNESEMRAERDSVAQVYSSQRDPPFNLEVRTDLSTDALREAIETRTDLLHYIGHVDERGFRCHDGWLDVRNCSTVAPEVFLLNSCRSYEQGERLIEQGATAGIVTLTDLLNHRAADIGRTLSLFLHHGFPLYAALDVVTDTYRFGKAYALLGDPFALLAQPTTTFPEYLEIERADGEDIVFGHHTFYSSWARLGTLINPPYREDERHYLFGQSFTNLRRTREQVEELLTLPMPLRQGGELRHSIPESIPRRG